VDDTFDAIHGEQQLRLFNAHSDQYGFQPTVVFDGEGRPVAAMLRRHTEFYDGAGSGSQGERIIARIEARPQGTGTRFVVTNLPGGSAHALYERRYCPRDQAENHLQAWKRHLAADRTSCCRATANQFRLMLHTGAYWLFWSLRSLMPKRSTWRGAVRYLAPAPGQTGHSGHHAEDLGHAAPAQRLSGPGHHPPRPQPSVTPDLLSRRADAPTEPSDPQPQAPRSHLIPPRL